MNFDEWDKSTKIITEHSNVIPWYKIDCEVCGQGANLCHDPRCPSVIAENDYKRKIERINKRTFIQRIAARILNEDE